jgi:phosphate/sulfate permease
MYLMRCRSTLATVGAIAGVGVWEGRSGFNALLFVKMVSGWILTIIAATSLTCERMSQQQVPATAVL